MEWYVTVIGNPMLSSSFISYEKAHDYAYHLGLKGGMGRIIVSKAVEYYVGTQLTQLG